MWNTTFSGLLSGKGDLEFEFRQRQARGWIEFRDISASQGNIKSSKNIFFQLHDIFL
jgi:hypothetical protein